MDGKAKAIINSPSTMAQKRADLINAGYSQGAAYAILAAATHAPLDNKP